MVHPSCRSCVGDVIDSRSRILPLPLHQSVLVRLIGRLCSGKTYNYMARLSVCGELVIAD
jgi:hypothetical protein